MNLTVIGVGKLGLCLALNLEKSGFNVLGIDVCKSYIDSLNNKSFKSSEINVNEYLSNAKNIKFNTSLEVGVENDIIFVVVGTPSTKEWKYDSSQIDDIADKLIKLGKQEKRKDLIINCTVFPGYCAELQKKLIEYNYYVSYNPEFIAQGTILKDQINADMVLIGEADEYAGNLIESIYSKMCVSNPKIHKMNGTEAEITKLSLNCFLTTKISYANMIGDIALKLNCDPDKVLEAIGSDSRIGNKYLKYGFGFGGPCFPRDNRALITCGNEIGIDAVIAKATDEMNEKHLNYQIEEFTKNNPDKNVIVEMEFITFKKESDILEESQQLKFALKLKELGYKIKVLDNRVFEKISF